jgi:SAM-dependent methyltransferase
VVAAVTSSAAAHWTTTPILPVIPALGRVPVRLFLTSAVVLFVELLLIRWIPANVTFVGFFRNFILMASFLGIGAGILFGRDQRRLQISPTALVLLATTVLVANQTLELKIPTDTEIFFGLHETQSSDAGFIVLALIVVLTSIIMASISLPLGSLLASMPPLRAYAIDIAGSMTGIAAFSLLSALQTGPTLWFAVVTGVLGLLALGTGVTRWSIVSGALLIATVIISTTQQPPGTTWSPYYRVSERPGPILGINVNGIPHQALWPAADDRKEPFYEQVYRWFPDRQFDQVLIVGAGSGTDTAVALAHGAGHVDAVEIDPFLQDIGVRKHPDRPYSDPRVDRTIDDGRAFLSRHSEQFDLIVFALPDSLTLVSTSANVRLESFLFTTEAFRAVRNHLKPGGIFVLYNYYRDPQLVTKLDDMLQSSFGGNVLIRRYPGQVSSAAALAAGPGIDDLHGGPPPGGEADAPEAPGGLRPATDDWPFLYLLEPGVPRHYIIALTLVLAWALLMIARGARRSGTPLRRFSPHFFVLGIAFLLLETRSIVTFSLLFGSTWLVNALVFFAVLASVLLAILVASRVRIHRTWLLYAGLLISLGVAFVLPPASLLIEPLWLRYVLATALAFAPVFFANLVFSFSFRDTRTADMAFASNLLGAMVGGAVEYVALITGYQALVLIVGGLYLAAYLLATRVRILADVDLTSTAVMAPAGD